MPPTPPDRPVGAAVPLHPEDAALKGRRRSSASSGAAAAANHPALLPVRLPPDPAPGPAPFGPGTPPLPMGNPDAPHGLAEAPAAFLHPADLSRPHATAPAFLPSFAPVFDPVAVPPDPALIARYGARFCLRHGLLPWQTRDGDILILTATPAAFETRRDALAAAFGPTIRPLPCPRDRIEAALLTHAADALTQDAETALPARHSARSLNHARNAALIGGLVFAAIAGLLLAFQQALTLLILLGLTSLSALFLLKASACMASLRHRPDRPAPPLPDDLLPVISVLIPLYGEAGIAARLIKRLARIDYPADRLDILILTEADDAPTRAALATLSLPKGIRVLSVPKGRVRTKPRALNFGLEFCRGRIVGIWDAEDAPAPDQLRKVAAAFDAAPPDLACLQGALDFYNPSKNWIAHCFTMEYALWFRLFLPGLERLGLPMPLGGTTLFLRRDAIEAAGGWDAHNVTEDADLGLRLARMGLHTAILDSTTMEEANCRIRPWIKQRARWSKGYLMTWLVHMRAPRALWRDLGPRRFLAVQALLLGSVLHGVTDPLILLLWLHSLPLGSPDWLPVQLPMPLVILMVAIRVADYAFILLAMRRTRHPGPGWRLLYLKPYGLLSTIAAIKAIGEAPLRPFHWDKTRHGDFHDDETEAMDRTAALTQGPPQAPPDPQTEGAAKPRATPAPHERPARMQAIAGRGARAASPDAVLPAPISASLSRPHPPAAASRKPC